jgi:hypothetical protein
MNASNNPHCNGCRHKDGGDNKCWCYMFIYKPTALPCGQHDMYEELRKRNGAKFLAANGIK